jgi:hypothetical protein
VNGSPIAVASGSTPGTSGGDGLILVDLRVPEDEATELMAELLELPDPPTAVFTMSDEMALGAPRELWDRGLDAPRDVSVIGVDNHEIRHRHHPEPSPATTPGIQCSNVAGFGVGVR